MSCSRWTPVGAGRHRPAPAGAGQGRTTPDDAGRRRMTMDKRRPASARDGIALLVADRVGRARPAYGSELAAAALRVPAAVSFHYDRT